MKPTLRSFFSGVPASANASVAVVKRKELCDGGERRGSPDRFQERPARGIFRKHRAHHRRGNDALVTFLFVRNRLASQRERRLIVLGFRPMLAAHAGRRRQRTVGIEGIVKGGHACIFLRASDAAASRHTIKSIARPRIRPGDEKHAGSMPPFRSAWARPAGLPRSAAKDRATIRSRSRSTSERPSRRRSSAPGRCSKPARP